MEVTLTIVDPDDATPDGLEAAPIELEGEGRIVGVRCEIDTEDVSVAIAQAVAAAAPMGGTIARVSAHNGTDAGPPIVGVSEIAEMKGCKRQYASQLGKRRDFPEMVATLRGTPVWETVQVALYLHDEGRNRVGRSG